jgi:uncharacterized protein (DUF1778 family)
MAFTLRLTAEEQELLHVLAEREGISQHEAVRRAIVDQARRLILADRVDATTDRVLDRYADLLDRLARS